MALGELDHRPSRGICSADSTSAFRGLYTQNLGQNIYSLYVHVCVCFLVFPAIHGVLVKVIYNWSNSVEFYPRSFLLINEFPVPLRPWGACAPT